MCWRVLHDGLRAPGGMQRQDWADGVGFPLGSHVNIWMKISFVSSLMLSAWVTLGALSEELQMKEVCITTGGMEGEHFSLKSTFPRYLSYHSIWALQCHHLLSLLIKQVHLPALKLNVLYWLIKAFVPSGHFLPLKGRNCSTISGAN